jgi:cation diffusion facilitator family transporter
MALRNQPQTREEISGTYRRFGGLLGFPTPSPGTKKYGKWQREMDKGLDHLLKLELVVIDEHGLHRLTETGIEEAGKLDQDLQKFTRSLSAFLSSGKTTAKLSIMVDLLLSVLKLGVGFLFNSMALMADGFDNLVDVVSAAVVFLGIKYRRELLSASFMILVMFITGGWIGYESVARLIHPEEVDTGLLAIVAAVISGLVCYLMSAYQYTAGKKTGSLSLISQSIDSKNHVFVAVAVLIGVVFARFDLFLVDSLVGLGVAAMILKSAIELTIETRRIAGGEEIDLSGFTRVEEKLFEQHRRNYFRSWLLFCLKDMHTKEEILSQCDRSFSTQGLPFVDQFGFIKDFEFAKHVDSLFKELIHEGLVTANNAHYKLTDKGNKLLKSRLASRRYM